MKTADPMIVSEICTQLILIDEFNSSFRSGQCPDASQIKPKNWCQPMFYMSAQVRRSQWKVHDLVMDARTLIDLSLPKVYQKVSVKNPRNHGPVTVMTYDGSWRRPKSDCLASTCPILVTEVELLTITVIPHPLFSPPIYHPYIRTMTCSRCLVVILRFNPYRITPLLSHVG